MLRKKAAYIRKNINLQYVMVIILYFEECDIFIKKWVYLINRLSSFIPLYNKTIAVPECSKNNCIYK